MNVTTIIEVWHSLDKPCGRGWYWKHATARNASVHGPFTHEWKALVDAEAHIDPTTRRPIAA